MLRGGLVEVPSLVANLNEVSANSRSMVRVSIAPASAGAPVSASASRPACAIRSNGERACSTGVVMSVTSPQPTRIGVVSSIFVIVITLSVRHGVCCGRLAA